MMQPETSFSSPSEFTIDAGDHALVILNLCAGDSLGARAIALCNIENDPDHAAHWLQVAEALLAN